MRQIRRRASDEEHRRSRYGLAEPKRPRNRARGRRKAGTERFNQLSARDAVRATVSEQDEDFVGTSVTVPLSDLSYQPLDILDASLGLRADELFPEAQEQIPRAAIAEQRQRVPITSRLFLP